MDGVNAPALPTQGIHLRWNSFPFWASKAGAEISKPYSAGPFLLPPNREEKKQRWGCLSPHLCALPSLGPGRPPEGPPGLAKLPTLSLPDGHTLQPWPSGHLVSLGVFPQPPQPSAPPSQPAGTSLLPVPPPPCLAHSRLKAQTAPHRNTRCPQPHPMECSFWALKVHLLPKVSLQLTDPLTSRSPHHIPSF